MRDAEAEVGVGLGVVLSVADAVSEGVWDAVGNDRDCMVERDAERDREKEGDVVSTEDAVGVQERLALMVMDRVMEGVWVGIGDGVRERLRVREVLEDRAGLQDAVGVGGVPEGL